METVWKTLKITGYILLTIFGINLAYVSILYAIRHEDWFFIYNPDLGIHSNAILAWQILWSIILALISFAIVSISKSRLKALDKRTRIEG